MSIKQMSEVFTNPYGWINAGSITDEADSADYTVTARDDASVEALADAKKVIIRPPNGTVAIELRFRSDGSADVDSILQMFAAAGVDHYVHIAQLTVTQGEQIDTGSIYFCDGITPASEIWITTVTELTTIAENIGSYLINTHGYDRFWFVANDLDTTTVYIDWRRF